MPDSPAKQLPPPPHVAAVVLRSGDLEATISNARIQVSHVGPRDGRTKMFDLNVKEADALLNLVQAGRATLAEMDAKS